LHPRIESSGRVSSSGAGVSGGSIPGGSASGERLVDSLQSALGASSRNEAGLGSLQRAIRDASRAFTASRQAQESLTEELRVMHRGLNELMSEKAAVERYASLLTQERDAALDAAEEARREAKREREFLLREQDRFIQLLLEEHEAEVQQLRRAAGQARASGGEPRADVAPATVPGMPATASDQPVEGRNVAVRASGLSSNPPVELLSGAALARQALANAGVTEAPRAVPLPADRLASDPPAGDEPSAAGDGVVTETQRSELRVDDERVDERAPSYPPAPAVLDLDALAAEVDGNSERPPPIRRLNVAEAKIHLKPARVPTQLFDTLVSPIGESDPSRKG
jgi:hypothetical protein